MSISAPVSGAAERLARELDLDIDTIQGTGYKGKVLASDVQKAFADRQAEAEQGAQNDNPLPDPPQEAAAPPAE